MLITPIAVLHQKPRWGARMVVFDGAMGSAKLLEICGYSGVDVPVPCSPLSAGAGREAVIARAGGASGCSSVCQQFLAFWAAPRISENKNELMTVPLMPSEDGVFPMSQILCLPSSLQAQTSKMYARVIFVAFLAKK